MSKRKPATEHAPNGPYYPVGLMGGEYCRKCREAWPCEEAPEPYDGIMWGDD